MSYNLCIFDLDGTLTDPEVGITKSYQYALKAFGIHEELDSLARLIGPPLRHNFGKVYGFSSSDTEKAVVIYREYFAAAGVFENVVYPGIPEMLQSLKESGKTLAVATNKAEVFAKQIVKHFDIEKYFACVSGDELDGSRTINGKRDIIRIVLDALDPKRELGTVMIGDREHDIIGAIENGIDGIGITWGFGSYEELTEAGSIRIIESPSELCHFLMP